MSEVPLHILGEKPSPSLGPYSKPMLRAIVVLEEGAISYERGTPVHRLLAKIY